jgi:hypothetical protein
MSVVRYFAFLCSEVAKWYSITPDCNAGVPGLNPEPPPRSTANYLFPRGLPPGMAQFYWLAFGDSRCT